MTLAKLLPVLIGVVSLIAGTTLLLPVPLSGEQQARGQAPRSYDQEILGREHGQFGPQTVKCPAGSGVRFELRP